MIKIEKGIRIVAMRHHKNKSQEIADAFSKMKVGDSFLMKKNGKKTSPAQVLSVHAHLYCKKNPGVKFSTRTVHGGGRIWRIA